jgi:hypothetical protein
MLKGDESEHGIIFCELLSPANGDYFSQSANRDAKVGVWAIRQMP